MFLGVNIPIALLDVDALPFFQDTDLFTTDRDEPMMVAALYARKKTEQAAVGVLTMRGVVRYVVFFVMKLKTRRVAIAGITRSARGLDGADRAEPYRRG